MTRKPIDRFEDEWKEWAERPTVTSPQEAAREVLERLDEPRFPSAASVRFLAAAAVVLMTFGVWFFAPSWSSETAESAAAVETPPLDEGVVLFWLDPQTPLYMTWNPPRAEKGDAS